MTTIKLKHPVTLGMGELATEITLARPKLKYIREANNRHKNDDMAQIMYVVSKMTGWVPKDLDELDLEDWNTIQTAYIDMMGKPQTKTD